MNTQLLVCFSVTGDTERSLWMTTWRTTVCENTHTHGSSCWQTILSQRDVFQAAGHGDNFFDWKLGSELGGCFPLIRKKWPTGNPVLPVCKVTLRHQIVRREEVFTWMRKSVHILGHCFWMKNRFYNMIWPCEPVFASSCSHIQSWVWRSRDRSVQLPSITMSNIYCQRFTIIYRSDMISNTAFQKDLPDI